VYASPDGAELATGVSADSGITTTLTITRSGGPLPNNTTYYVTARETGVGPADKAESSRVALTVLPPEGYETLGVFVSLTVGKQVTVKLENGTDIADLGLLVLSRSGAGGKPTEMTLTATGYDNSHWVMDGDFDEIFDGNSILGNASAFTVRQDGAEGPNHSITFFGEQNGVPYSKEIPFAVVK
jgi:hypothetical protein